MVLRCFFKIGPPYVRFMEGTSLKVSITAQNRLRLLVYWVLELLLWLSARGNRIPQVCRNTWHNMEPSRHRACMAAYQAPHVCTKAADVSPASAHIDALALFVHKQTTLDKQPRSKYVYTQTVVRHTWGHQGSLSTGAPRMNSSVDRANSANSHWFILNLRCGSELVIASVM